MRIPRIPLLPPTIRVLLAGGAQALLALPEQLVSIRDGAFAGLPVSVVDGRNPGSSPLEGTPS